MEQTMFLIFRCVMIVVFAVGGLVLIACHSKDLHKGVERAEYERTARVIFGIVFLAMSFSTGHSIFT